MVWFCQECQHLTIVTDSSNVHSGKQREAYPTRPGAGQVNQESAGAGREKTVGPDESAGLKIKSEDSEPILTEVRCLSRSQIEN